MFSKADYELASRVLGLPVPQTDAEMAAAAPMTARVIREFALMRPPVPGQEPDGMYTGATRSLNAMPDCTQPMEKAQLSSRLRTETQDPYQDEYLVSLLEVMEGNPEIAEMLLMVLEFLKQQQQEHMEALSSQRPAEYDTPNLGSNYSLINAPSSNGIPPSQAFQSLS